MCGILAIYGKSVTNLFSKQHLDNQIKKVKHRGPDNINSIYLDDTYLAHSRLSILDLDDRSNQPFLCDGYIMVYNGEVFNYKEIRTRLTKLGFTFQTDSDTEVVIKAFIAWGTKCFAEFNGMWALVIKSPHDGSIIVSRDRFGQKPLFYSYGSNTYFFSSEPQQITTLVDSKPCLSSIRNFILEGDALNDGRTFFDNIFEFPAAHTLVIDTDLNTKIERYWDYPLAEDETTETKFHEFNNILRDAVEIRLEADVPVSICLSGGIDSTVISAIASEIVPPSELNFFTYKAFDEYDESVFAAQIADRLSGQITVVEQQSTPEQYINSLRELVLHMGRGHSSPAIISSDLIHQKISEKSFKVSINGQGADELLAGYKTHYVHSFIDQILKLELSNFFKSFRHMLQQKSQFSNKILRTVLIRYLRDVSGPFVLKCLRRVYGYEKLISSKDFGYSKPHTFQSQESVAWSSAGKLKRHLLLQHQYGLKDLLFYEDIVAMKNSIENRSPFLDHRLVDLAFSCDENLKIDNGLEKAVLRRSKWYNMHKDLLERDKVGFQSTIRPETKRFMRNQLLNSDILELPIFTKFFVGFLKSGDILLPKYERLLFRIFQVHLWFEIYKLNTLR